MTYDAGDKVAVGQQKKKSKLQQERELEELRQLLEKPSHRAFLWRVLSQCGVYQTNSSPEQGVMAFREGRRSVGLWLIEQMLTAMPASYAIMREEAAIRESHLTTGS